MGLFSTFSSKSSSGAGSHASTPSGSAHLDASHHPNDRTPGKISGLEIGKVHRDLVDRFGRTKGERIYAELLPNMDRERGIGSSGISAHEAEEAIHNMEKNPYDGIDKHDTEKLKDILDKRL